MVEPNNNQQPRTQLPCSNAPEETKDAQSFMSGSEAEFEADVMHRLQGVELNVLEEGLLKQFIKNRATCRENVLGLLYKLEQKHLDDNYQLKRIRKVIPLF